MLVTRTITEDILRSVSLQDNQLNKWHLHSSYFVKNSTLIAIEIEDKSD